MSKHKYVVDLVAGILPGIKPDLAAQTAETIVDRLKEEGLLNLGYGDTDVDRAIQAFVDTFGVTKTSKIDRFAAHRLVRKYGTQSVCGVIKLLGANQDQKYVPVVNSVSELEQKWVSILNFVRKLNIDDTIDI